MKIIQRKPFPVAPKPYSLICILRKLFKLKKKRRKKKLYTKIEGNPEKSPKKIIFSHKNETFNCFLKTKFFFYSFKQLPS